ncbi:cytochrome c1 [Sagittula salina]|uniref:Cytochrome c1 n=1 Tax=Sagittula salina TaxID=2820268 RepID=A0A940MMZ8_9RHOB|nr:cytochrome c1 [Sagittula salina]MBP0482700.1 cytochrome c1 [Sagittula salina]
MFKKLTLAALTALGVSGALASGAHAAGGEAHVEDYAFSFEGPFGSYDQMQLQRGLKIFTEVCASCHGLKYVPIRDLGALGYNEDQLFAYAEQFDVFDQELNDGDGDFRPARPADNFPAVTSAAAPDLSMMAKARAGFHGPYGLGINQFFKGIGGAEYIASLMAGYHEAPECAPEDFPGYYNTVFTVGGYPEECKNEEGAHTVPGSWIAMPPPLAGDDVEFDDGHSASLHHEAADVAAFLMWTAEPKMNQRKEAGFIGVFFLLILSVLLYLVNKRIWAPIKRKH